jgi:hypothetical protein
MPDDKKQKASEPLPAPRKLDSDKKRRERFDTLNDDNPLICRGTD